MNGSLRLLYRFRVVLARSCQEVQHAPYMFVLLLWLGKYLPHHTGLLSRQRAGAINNDLTIPWSTLRKEVKIEDLCLVILTKCCWEKFTRRTYKLNIFCSDTFNLFEQEIGTIMTLFHLVFLCFCKKK